MDVHTFRRRLLGMGMLALAGAVHAQSLPAQGDDPSCPSQDFAQFLRHFSNPADDRVRMRYTTDPLEYETSAYGAASDDGPMATEVHWEAGPARLRRVRGATQTTAPAITPLADGGQQVRLGDDALGEQYTFARRYGCWMLTRVARLQD